MPPEQARGEPADCRSDVFGLGVILFEVLTGGRVYGPGPVHDVLGKATRGALADAYGRLDGCGADPELVALAKGCLAAGRADRPADGGEVARLVGEYQAGVEARLRAAEAGAAASAARRAEQRKKRRVQAALAASVVALVGLVGLGAWWQDRQAARAQLRQAEDAHRAARNTDALDALLDRCEAAIGGDDPAAAAVLLDQAELRLGEGDDGRAGRPARCRSDLRLMQDLDRVDRLFWTVVGGRRQVAAALAEWPPVLARAGFRPGTPIVEAVRTSGNSRLRGRVIAMMDRCLRPGDQAELVDVLRALDPDTYRDAVRWAILRGDDEEVRRLAGSNEAERQPARFAVVLGVHGAVPTDRREVL